MRRGHPGIGWRNDNPRHFRPRSGGTPHYRPPRGFAHVDAPRFQSPGPRSLLGQVRYASPNLSANDLIPPDHHDRRGFRGGRNNQRRPQGRGHYPHQGQRQIFPLLDRMRQGDVPDQNSYQDTPNYFDNNQKPWETMNSMGDIDHRQPPTPSRIGPWTNTPFNYEDRSPSKKYRHQDNTEHNKIPQPDYTGHRPPASDHYGSSHGSSMDNSNTFSRSVDDTVDIVRKRLLNRDSQPLLETPPHNRTESQIEREPVSNQYSNTLQDQPTKKKSHKLRNIKSNCDKIKNKIMHQLFMMDKDKIHKLMDNPNSSTKFEYAISSLVTESQNSFNRHLRSVAEKSLCSSTSTEFIHDDNNTIYEDTFMKEMQCILDPQDTVLLEDLKPMVLAELSKVLQLDDLQLQQEAEAAPSSRDDQPSYDQYSHEETYDGYSNFEPYSPVDDHDNHYEQKPRFEKSQSPEYGNSSNTDFAVDQHDYDSKHLFERRQAKKSRESLRRRSSEDRRRRDRRSIDSRSEDNFTKGDTPIPLFDSNVDQLSDDDDPFAELDRQYHVAVDHNFIKNDYMSSPQQSNKSSRASSPVIQTKIIDQKPNFEKPIQNKPPTIIINKITDQKPNSENPIQNKPPPIIIKPEKPPSQIKKEIDNQLQDIAKSPLIFLSPTKKADWETKESFTDNNPNNTHTPRKHIKSESIDNISLVDASEKHEPTPEPQATNTTPEKSESASSVKPATPVDSRKRSSDQKPSHRKEKRKKSDSNQQDTNKQILNKNIIIHVSDCAAKTADKSIFNLYFSKENNAKESSKDSKKIESSDKKYSDRHVKRKEKDSNSSKKQKEKDVETKKRPDSNTTSHSILSPTDVSNTSSQTAPKVDGQTKLKPIDMFVEHHKKPAPHLTHRNTAVPATPNKNIPVLLKTVVLNRKITKRHIATQVLRKCSTKETQTMVIKSSSSRFSQTDRKKLMTRGTQTEPVSFKPTSKSADTFERMKEIDMEIQALLQEKFKLYNSLESKESGPNTMQSLGMAVLNVAPVDEHDGDNSISEDSIVDDFTNIPVEELEQIALESVQEEQNQLAAQSEKKSRRQKVQEQDRRSRNSSLSTNASTSSSRSKRAKPINISLIEQIITDNRPLEDIISLDDFESPPKKRSHKKKSTPKKKNANKKDSTRRITDYDIKPCSVHLKRDDLNKLLRKFQDALRKRKTHSAPTPEKPDVPPVVESVPEPTVEEITLPAVAKPNEQTAAQTVLMVEAAINDIQFDMLDVSEDIEIGDVCEVKSCEEKEASDRSTPAVSEDIILDNSQPSTEEADGAGGECKIYDYSADENLRRDSVTVSGNGDAVLAIECIDGNFIAACLDGNVYYFSGEGRLLNTLRGSNLAVTCLTVVRERGKTTVYTGSLDSRIRYYDLETGLEKGPECNVLSPIQTMDRAWDTVFVGTRTGFVLQFECKNNMLIPVSTVKFSDQSILALRAMKEGPRKVLLVAARSEPVTIKDAQTGLLLRTLEGPKMTVYTLLLEDGKVFCGTSGHQIHVFDYASGSHIGSHEGGKGAVCLRANGGLIFAGCYDGCVYVYKEGGAAPLAQLRGPGLMLLSLAVLDTKIIAGYKDRSLYIWKIPQAVFQEMIL